jgi:hypothetical protein
MIGLSKLPAAVAAFLIALIYSTCGALSLCVAAAFFFLKVCMNSAICSMSVIHNVHHLEVKVYIWFKNVIPVGNLRFSWW